jgi:hypothetical protein
LLVAQYSARQHVFSMVQAGLRQNLAKTWNVRYMVTLYQGPNREGHFGFQVQFDAFRF